MGWFGLYALQGTLTDKPSSRGGGKGIAKANVQGLFPVQGGMVAAQA